MILQFCRPSGTVLRRALPPPFAAHAPTPSGGIPEEKTLVLRIGPLLAGRGTASFVGQENSPGHLLQLQPAPENTPEPVGP